MHEMSVASALVQTVLENVKDMKATKVEEIIFEVGELAFISELQLVFCFDMLKNQHDVLKVAKLKLQKTKAQVMCPKCGFTGDLKNIKDTKKAQSNRIAISFECPKCRETLNIKSGREMVVKRICVEVSDDKPKKKRGA